jgi:hypothetical protein
MKMVRVGPNPTYKLPKDPEAAKVAKPLWEQIKGERPKTLPYVTAMENLRNSGGMYAILPEAAPATSSPGVRMPEEMTADELKLTALQLGVDLTKPMKKADLVKTVRLAMDKVQLLVDDSEEEDGAA